MICLLEGPDGAGKTTLSLQLAQRLDVPVWNRPMSPLYGKITTRDSQLLHETELSLLERWVGDIVIDRFIPSEWAYNTSFGRDFDEELLLDHWDRFKKLDPQVVLLYWPAAAAAELIDERTDDEVPVSTIRDVTSRYLEFFDRYGPYDTLKLNCEKDPNEVIEFAMGAAMKKRPRKDELYMNMAFEAARRSTCLSRRTGAVLVSARGHVIATGYNGAPVGCDPPRSCARLRAGSASGTNLGECDDVHAEENAIVQAGLNGSTPEGATLYTVNSPCSRCARMLINARIGEVVYHKLYGDTRAIELFERARIKMREVGQK